MPSIKLSQQTHEDFQKLKTIISQMLGKDEVDDDQVIASMEVIQTINSKKNDVVDEPVHTNTKTV